jgi:glycosyltransferase involved in cell wall biosynthesis
MSAEPHLLSSEPRPAALASGTSTLPGLSIVLPCFNEAGNVAAAVEAALLAASANAHAVQVVVVDDGSTDETRAIAEAIALSDPRVTVVAHDGNRGYGAAVRSGIAASTMPWILLTDGDLQFDLTEISAFLEPAAHHEMVVGYRIQRQDRLHRRLSAAAWNRLMHATFGVRVRDIDCAFKLMRGDLARDLELESEGAMVSTELLARAQAQGWRITELGVHHYPRQAGEASGGDLRVIARAFAERRALRRKLCEEAAAARRDHPTHRAVTPLPRRT